MIYLYSTHNITCMQQVDRNNIMKFAQRVKELRLKHSKSLNSLVFKKGGRTSATWSRVENGKNDCKLSTLIKISAVLGITVDELLKGIDFDYSLDEE